MSAIPDNYGFFDVDAFLNSPLQAFLFYFSGSSEFIPDRFSASLKSSQWASTIQYKVIKMDLAYDDLGKQVPVWENIPELAKERGINALEEGFRLALRYETYLHTIYSLCDSLGKIARWVFPRERLPKGHAKLPQGFRKQRIYAIDNIPDDAYGRLLTTTDWYVKMRDIRAETTHSLSGFITSWKDDVPGYYIQRTSANMFGPPEMEIDNIVAHVEDLQIKVHGFLNGFGSVFIDCLDPETTRTFPCFLPKSSNQIFVRSLSLRELRGSKIGKCNSLHLECPVQHRCLAYKAALADHMETSGSNVERTDIDEMA